MITSQDEAYIFKRAYVPEHILNLMASVSKGEPFLSEDHLILARDNWLILVGYPLDRQDLPDRCERVLKSALDTFRPEYLWFIGPKLPSSLSTSCRERESDHYYELDLEQKKTSPSLLKKAERALKELTVERTHSVTRDHDRLIGELLKRENLPLRIRSLYLAMDHYVTHSKGSFVLNAWNSKRQLSAFYVVDLSAKEFTTYVLGGHSKKHYVPHASDLLFLEMINLTREYGKKRIHLGLGVNPGIRRFKEKWGGVPSLPYEFCEHYTGRTRTIALIQSIESKL